MIFRGFCFSSEGYRQIYQGRHIFVSAENEEGAHAKIVATMSQILEEPPILSDIDWLCDEFCLKMRGGTKHENGDVRLVERDYYCKDRYINEDNALILCAERDYMRLKQAFRISRQLSINLNK